MTTHPSNNAIRTRLITDARMRMHEVSPNHPESPARLKAIADIFKAQPVESASWHERVEPAEEAFPGRLHESAYVDEILALRGQRVQLDADTAVHEHSVEAAFLALGAARLAVIEVLAGTVSNAFVFPRPPGHHAERARAMGFCLFGTVALAAEHAIQQHGLERVLILDWDVHHGNGTQDLLSARRDILVMNLHQYPLYPGSGRAEEIGEEEGLGYTVNVPLPGGCGDTEYLAAFEGVVRPVVEQYEPELVLVSAGFDAHELDPLANQLVTTEGFARFTAIARELAERHAAGRLVLVLEGGYHLGALAASCHACAQVLSADANSASLPRSAESCAAKPEALARIHHVQRVLRDAGPWKL